MRTLIKIVFVIFIAKGIDCLGCVCDDFCNCLKDKKEDEKKEEEKKDDKNNDEEINKNEEIEKYEEIKEDENITAKSLVNNIWYESKKENLVLKIFKKKEDKAFTSTENGDKISIKLGKDNKPKIDYQNEAEDGPKLEYEKYAFCEIKTNTNKTVYLYCSDVESIFNGIFEDTTHVSISVIACDTEKVTDMSNMFCNCKNLTKLEFGEKFNTTNVKNMAFMFVNCGSLTKLDLKNFNTSNVTDMRYMFCGCSKFTKLNLENFDTTKVNNMELMFSGCSSLENLDISNFNTERKPNVDNMFSGCEKLSAEIKLKFQM